MDCSCSIMVDGDDYGPDVFEANDRKARKVHKCVECRREIQIGETYLEEAGLWEGEWSRFKTCRDCESIRRTFFKGFSYFWFPVDLKGFSTKNPHGFGFGYTWLLADLKEYIRETYGDVPPECIRNLTKPARDRACDMIEEQWARDEGAAYVEG